MATIVTKKLSIDKNNIEQYCDAQNVSFNVADHAWRKYLNGSTDGYIILADAGKSELYPTGTAHPFKADSLISASRSAGSCSVGLQFAGTTVHEESYTSTSQTQRSKSGISDGVVANSTSATEIKWHVSGANLNNQRGDLIELTLYFNQYTMSAKTGTGSNGVKSVSVSDATPYYGDSVTFSAVLESGAVWSGWYSDEDCTVLVSTSRDYTVSPSADLTLYTKSIIHTCAAVAKDCISLASVDKAVVSDGGTVTFIAQLNDGCSFVGWFSDPLCTNLVSLSNPYTTSVGSDTTLYAKAALNNIQVTVPSLECGTAVISPSVIFYGDSVTITFSPKDDMWQFSGWYSDPSFAQFLSDSNPYTFVATDDTVIYPKVTSTPVANTAFLFEQNCTDMPQLSAQVDCLRAISSTVSVIGYNDSTGVYEWQEPGVHLWWRYPDGYTANSMIVYEKEGSVPDPSGKDDDGSARISTVASNRDYWYTETSTTFHIGSEGVGKTYYYRTIPYNSKPYSYDSCYQSAQRTASVVADANTRLTSLSNGSLIRISVGGYSKNFILIHSGVPQLCIWGTEDYYGDDCFGAWLLMQDIYALKAWDDSGGCAYSSSSIHTYLNGTFYYQFSSGVRNIIRQVNLPTMFNNGNCIEHTACKVFLLNGNEISWSDYFNWGYVDEHLKANYNGTATEWYLRDGIYTDFPDAIAIGSVDANGYDYDRTNSTDSIGIRPAIVLPLDTRVNPTANSDGSYSLIL